MLSIKVLTSNLLNKHFEAFINGDKDAIVELIENFQVGMVTLSEFLFAQTKIMIRKKNLEKRQLQTSQIIDFATIDISASSSSIPLISKPIEETKTPDKEDQQQSYVTKDHELKPHQLQLLRNIIQLFASENHFIDSIMKKILSQSYNGKNQIQLYEWLIHPKWELNEDTCRLDVVLNEHNWQYKFEFQGVSSFPQVTLENERSLYWLSWE